MATQAPPTACGTGGIPWHKVLLKQPGEVPAGAGGLGGATGEFAPFAWQKTHTEAFPSAADVWTYVSPVRHCDGCGALTAWQG
jgi:hypothetical protein